MTAEQIRRSRGALAILREVPPEQTSVWRFWNSISCLGCLGTILFAKELLIWEPNIVEQIMQITIFSMFGAIVMDWWSWAYVITQQEDWDKKWMPLNDKLQNLNLELENIAQKPDLRTILVQMGYYRDYLSQVVLQKTMSNQLRRTLDNTIKKLRDKIGHETAVRRETENEWQRQALDATLKYFDNDGVKNNFTKQGIQQFCSEGFAVIGSGKEVTADNTLFEKQYHSNLQIATKKYLDAAKKDGHLNWVFRDDKEKQAATIKANDKKQQFTKRVKEWETSHNPVGNVTPSFA